MITVYEIIQYRDKEILRIQEEIKFLEKKHEDALKRVSHKQNEILNIIKNRNDTIERLNSYEFYEKNKHVKVWVNIDINFKQLEDFINEAEYYTVNQ